MRQKQLTFLILNIRDFSSMRSLLLNYSLRKHYRESTSASSKISLFEPRKDCVGVVIEPLQNADSPLQTHLPDHLALVRIKALYFLVSHSKYDLGSVVHERALDYVSLSKQVLFVE